MHLVCVFKPPVARLVLAQTVNTALPESPGLRRPSISLQVRIDSNVSLAFN
jgi:hypothetical protein